MCRFLLVKSKKTIDPVPFLRDFADMAKKSKAFDGDWQGDGWGVSWLDDKGWNRYRSLKPVWQDTAAFDRIHSTKLLMVHARSASFPQHKHNIEFNQPYIENPYSFVFNGFLMGVRLSLPGKIGAEKIWNYLKTLLLKKNPVDALEKTGLLLKKNSRTVQALNIGLSDGKHLYALNYFTKHPQYYRLHRHKDSNLSVICSEPLELIELSPTESGTILSL